MIFKVRPLIIEQVRLKNGKINENGALYKVIWFNTGDYEIHPLQPVKTINQVGRIPFNPNYPRIRNGEDVEADNRWGVRMSRYMLRLFDDGDIDIITDEGSWYTVVYNKAYNPDENINDNLMKAYEEWEKLTKKEKKDRSE